jgi:hypothetical protein
VVRAHCKEERHTSTLVVRNAALIVTMDATLGDIANGRHVLPGGVIEEVGQASALPTTADGVLDQAPPPAMPH